MTENDMKRTYLLLDQLYKDMFRECNCNYNCEGCAFGMIKEPGELKTCSIEHVKNTIADVFDLGSDIYK